MIITISGAPGSGKSTVAKKLSEALGWPRYYMGGIRRDIAAKKGMTLAEFNKLGETDPSTDLEVDEYQTELGKTQDNFVIEGRTSWHFIPQSLKIFIDVDEKVGAARIFSDLQHNAGRNEDNNLHSPEEVLASMKNRVASDSLRYFKYFGIDVLDKKNYDLTVDTTHLTPEETFNKVFDFLRSKMPE